MREQVEPRLVERRVVRVEDSTWAMSSPARYPLLQRHTVRSLSSSLASSALGSRRRSSRLPAALGDILGWRARRANGRAPPTTRPCSARTRTARKARCPARSRAPRRVAATLARTGVAAACAAGTAARAETAVPCARRATETGSFTPSTTNGTRTRTRTRTHRPSRFLAFIAQRVRRPKEYTEGGTHRRRRLSDHSGTRHADAVALQILERTILTLQAQPLSWQRP